MMTGEITTLDVVTIERIFRTVRRVESASRAGHVPAPVHQCRSDLVPIIACGVDIPEGGAMIEFVGLHDDGYHVLACRPRRSGLGAVGIAVGPCAVGEEGVACVLAGTVARSLMMGNTGAQPGDRIGAVGDSFAGAPNPLGRFLLRGYDAGEAIIEITEPPVDRKLVQLPTGQIVSVREIEAGQEYTVTQDAAGQFVWTRAE